MIPKCSQKSLKGILSNCRPLSDINTLGTQNLLIIFFQMKFLVVRIDYFTKWVEVEALAKITQQNVKNFV